MVKMSKEDFENGIGVLMKVCNQDLIDDIGKLAVAIRDDGPNSHNEELSKECKTYETMYNTTYKPAVDTLIKDFQDSFDFMEFMEKQSVGSLGVKDAGFNVKRANVAKTVI